jgi:RNA polymerase sigma factor (sigma-70 family)
MGSSRRLGSVDHPRPTGAETDAELLADTANPAESFATFYRRHANGVLRFIASRGADAETAADVVSETFLAALRQRSRYRETHDSARLWLLGIAVRRLGDQRRLEQRERARVARVGEHASVLSDMDYSSYEALARGTVALDALADLPDDERLVILARVVEGQGYAEIAKAFGVKEPAVRKRLSRGLGRLRNRLERTTP